jgi:hypothetical protein
MRVEFRQGVPDGCARWLRENVGLGNIEEDSNNKRTRQGMIDMPEYAWFYERVAIIPDDALSLLYESIHYVPTITVKDPELATFFSLRWL